MTSKRYAISGLKLVEPLEAAMRNEDLRFVEEREIT